METIPKADCENIGFIRKTHGVHGAVVLEFEPQYDPSVENTNRFFIELDGLLVPFYLQEEGLRFLSSKSAILTFEDVSSEEYAKRLVNNGVYLFNFEIVQIEEEFSVSEFVNYLLKDEKEGEIGRIEDVEDYSGNVVFTVIRDNEEVLVPFNDELIVSIDDVQKIITLRLPEGLL